MGSWRFGGLGGESDPSGPYIYPYVIFDPCYAAVVGQTRALHYQAFFRSSLIFRGCFTRTILVYSSSSNSSLDTACSINYVVEKD